VFVFSYVTVASWGRACRLADGRRAARSIARSLHDNYFSWHRLRFGRNHNRENVTMPACTWPSRTVTLSSCVPYRTKLWFVWGCCVGAPGLICFCLGILVGQAGRYFYNIGWVANRCLSASISTNKRVVFGRNRY